MQFFKIHISSQSCRQKQESFTFLPMCPTLLSPPTPLQHLHYWRHIFCTRKGHQTKTKPTLGLAMGERLSLTHIPWPFFPFPTGLRHKVDFTWFKWWFVCKWVNKPVLLPCWQERKALKITNSMSISVFYLSHIHMGKPWLSNWHKKHNPTWTLSKHQAFPSGQNYFKVVQDEL